MDKFNFNVHALSFEELQGGTTLMENRTNTLLSLSAM